MRFFTIATVVVLCLGLGGCPGQQVPEPYVVSVTPEPPRYPDECTAPDPAWVEPPDRTMRLSEIARNYRTNKNSYGEIIARRRVCRAGIIASKKTEQR